MADQKIELEIVLDDGSVKRAFATVRKEAEDTEDSFGNAFRVQGLADFKAGIDLVSIALRETKRIAEALLNDVLAGEKIDAINRRFEILAQQQAINADALASGIARSVDGTVDMEAALESAGRALINLQVGTREIPQLFELARKSASAFGGDTVANFERIQQAIITGNARALREVGIFINSEQAYKRLADSIGTLPNNLSETGKQQAILNEVLRVGEERLKNISSSITPVEKSLKVLAVSFGEVGDTFAMLANKILGPVLQGAFQQLANGFDLINIRLREFLLGTAPSAAENVRLLNDELTRLTLLRDQQANLANSEAEVAILDTQILQLRAKLDAQTQLATKQAEKNELDLRGNEIARETLLLNQELTKSQIEGRAALEEYNKMQKKAALDAQMAANQVNQAVKAAIVNGIVQSIQAMMTALVKGTNVIQAVGSAILGLFADLAIQVGTIFLSTGIGMLATKFLDPTGAITAGLGLIALGSLMKAAFSGGGVTGGANTGVTATGGGVAFTGDTQTLIQQNEERDMVRAPQTVVNFQVMGDILDSSDTQNRIVSLLNDAIDTKGAVIRGV
jgi:hypothetical protein